MKNKTEISPLYDKYARVLYCIGIIGIALWLLLSREELLQSPLWGVLINGAYLPFYLLPILLILFSLPATQHIALPLFSATGYLAATLGASILIFSLGFLEFYIYIIPTIILLIISPLSALLILPFYAWHAPSLDLQNFLYLPFGITLILFSLLNSPHFSFFFLTRKEKYWLNRYFTSLLPQISVCCLYANVFNKPILWLNKSTISALPSRA